MYGGGVPSLTCYDSIMISCISVLKHHFCLGKQCSMASDFFQDWWAKVTHGAKNGGSFSEMMGPSISN